MKRFIRITILFVFACLIAAFAVANRQPVRFYLDPFMDRDVSPSIAAPLFAYIFAALFAGMMIGAISMWFSQGRWRRRARIGREEAAHWKHEAEKLKQGIQPGSGEASAVRSPLHAFLGPR